MRREASFSFVEILPLTRIGMSFLAVIPVRFLFGRAYLKGTQ
jgi:hypothetical protein